MKTAINRISSFFLAFYLCLSVEAEPTNHQESEILYGRSNVLFSTKLETACSNAMVQVQGQLSEAAKDFPILSGLKDVSIEGIGTISGSPEKRAVKRVLIFEKNVHEELIDPSMSLQQPWQRIVGKPGICLHILITDNFSKAPRTEVFPLGIKFVDGFSGCTGILLYYLEANPPDQKLQAFVQNLLATQVQKLRAELRESAAARPPVDNLLVNPKLPPSSSLSSDSVK